MAKKTLPALCLLVALCLTAAPLAGCSADARTPEETLAAVRENLADLQSLRWELTLNADMTAVSPGASREFSLASDLTAETICSPFQMRAEMALDLGELGRRDLTLYAEADGARYVSLVRLDGADAWSRETLDAADFAPFNGAESLRLWLSLLQNAAKAGEETTDGAKTVRYDGIIAGADLPAVIKTSGALAQLGQLGLTEDVLTGSLAVAGDLPFRLWIDPETLLPVRCDFDLGPAVDSLLGALASAGALGDSAVSVSRYCVSMTVAGANDVASLERPDAAG